MTDGQLCTAGETVTVRAPERWFGLLGQAAGGAVQPVGSAVEPTVLVEISQQRAAFPLTGLRLVSRGAWSDGDRTVLANAGGSGFDLAVRAEPELLRVQARYRPTTSLRAANTALSARFALLAGQILLHYPAIWRAGWRGRAPLHVAAYVGPDGATMIAGPAGVGKSTLLAAAIRDGAAVTADNLCVADGRDCYGVAEPLRLEPGRLAGPTGRDTSHGRSEQPMRGRLPSVRPDRILVLERAPVTELGGIEPGLASRALVAGTYAAGELRRYWQLAALLALATGRGPAAAPVTAVAERFTDRLPCQLLRVGDGQRYDLLRIGRPARTEEAL